MMWATNWPARLRNCWAYQHETEARRHAFSQPLLFFVQ